MSPSLLLGVIYFLLELLLTLTRRSRSRTGTKQDRSTLLVVWLVITASVAAGIYVTKCWPSATLPHYRSFMFVGVALFVTGLFSRWWAIIILGRFFTLDVTIELDHQLIDRGPFRVVRHPSYTGVLLAFVGLALTLQLGRAARYTRADWRGFRSPHERGGECVIERAWTAIHGLHATHKAAGAFHLLKSDIPAYS